MFRRSRTCLVQTSRGRVFLLKPGSWAGPVKSGYGVHLVRITDLARQHSAHFRRFGRRSWRSGDTSERTQTKAQYLGKLREKYGVVIDESVTPLARAASE